MIENRLKTILCVVGARPNFMKIAPLMRAFAKAGAVRAELLHTGQHYDADMSDVFFQELGIPQPDLNLEVGSGSHAVQTAQIMMRFETVVKERKPDAILVVGDVNSTIACALVAAKLGVKVIHVEAGLRSFDRAMPEEINRVLTDQISDLLFATERAALDNLTREGIPADKVHFVGNVMIDTLHYNLTKAVPSTQTWGAIDAAAAADAAKGFGIVTLHRPSNVDDPAVLRGLIHALMEISDKLPLIFPAHPRTRTMIEFAGLLPAFIGRKLHLVKPLTYLTLLGLLRDAAIVLTDSGGLQEESTALGIPCLTLRENTERTTTVSEGSNRLVGNDPARILAAFEAARAGVKRGRVPPLWDGKSAIRIVQIIDREAAAW
jgi:UDP-N-acetylglucosamine 2-epimerase (non-hydrolysing)